MLWKAWHAGRLSCKQFPVFLCECHCWSSGLQHSLRQFFPDSFCWCSCSFCLGVCFSALSLSSVLTRQPLVSTLTHLIPPAVGSGRNEYFQPGVEGFEAKRNFPWDQLLKCFLGNFVGVVHSELNRGLFGSAKNNNNNNNKMCRPTHSFNRWENLTSHLLKTQHTFIISQARNVEGAPWGGDVSDSEPLWLSTQAGNSLFWTGYTAVS